MSRTITCLLVLLMLAACQPNAPTPFQATLPPTRVVLNAAGAPTMVPTANPVASRTPTLPPSPTFTPTVTPSITPSPTITLSPTPTLTPTIAPTSTPIPSATPTDPANDPNNTPPPTWTPPPDDPLVQLEDHYRLRRPISDSGVNYVARTYPYGSNAGGLRIHLGVDMENPSGTPIIAAADGVVFYAGSDAAAQFGPSTNYYGNLVVIEHGFKSADGKTVYSLYGHMQRVDVQSGQLVKQGDGIGVVGGTGVAFGPHLHFEVRLGDAYSFSSTTNPELWMYPYQKFGTLVGRVTDSSGAVLYNVPLQVKSVNITRYAFTYADTTVNPDVVFQENFVLGDLPANYYEVSVTDNGRVRFRQIIYVYPNRSTWIDIQLR